MTTKKGYQITYEATVIQDDKYVTVIINAKNIRECKEKAELFGEPVRIYRFAELVWEKSN